MRLNQLCNLFYANTSSIQKITVFTSLTLFSLVNVNFSVTYFENNRAGITVFGWMLDRTTLHTIFGFELSLVLWLLGKTIGIS